MIINSDPAETLHGAGALIGARALGWDARSQIKYLYSDRPKTLHGAIDLGGAHVAWRVGGRPA